MGGGVKEGGGFNFTHQEVNKLNFGDFLLHCSTIGGEKLDGINGRRWRTAWREREGNKSERWGQEKEVRESYFNKLKWLEASDEFFMTVMRTDWFITQDHACKPALTHSNQQRHGTLHYKLHWRGVRAAERWLIPTHLVVEWQQLGERR